MIATGCDKTPILVCIRYTFSKLPSPLAPLTPLAPLAPFAPFAEHGCGDIRHKRSSPVKAQLRPTYPKSEKK